MAIRSFYECLYSVSTVASGVYAPFAKDHGPFGGGGEGEKRFGEVMAGGQLLNIRELNDAGAEAMFSRGFQAGHAEKVQLLFTKVFTSPMAR